MPGHDDFDISDLARNIKQRGFARLGRIDINGAAESDRAHG
jgi:hypothetical protein